MRENESKMRLHMLRAGVVASAAALALAACASHGLVPSSPSGASAMGSDAGAFSGGMDAIHKRGTTCDTSPPQYLWIFKGSCDSKIVLKPTGATFSLATYDDITIKGTIGKNTTKGTANIIIADATDTGGDIETYKGKAFPPYKAKGKTFVYAVAVNQSTQTIKPIAVKGKPILQYVITDSKGLPGQTCGVALLAQNTKGQFQWSSFPGTFKASGKTITITQYNVPAGFEFPPKTPLYFGVNCY